MDRNLKSLLACELTGSSSYVDRLLRAYLETDLTSDQLICEKLDDYYNDLIDILFHYNYFLPTHWIRKKGQLGHRALIRKIQSLHKILLNSLELDFDADSSIEAFSQIINRDYSFAHFLHGNLQAIYPDSIQYPRINLIEMVSEKSEKILYADIPLFVIYSQDIQRWSKENNTELNLLMWKREKNYKAKIQQGQFLMSQNNFRSALECFQRSLQFCPCPEALTLMAWAYSKLGQIDKAKVYCLKAIKLDANYAPPYNDLGSYLLSQGKVDESLIWFEKAKKISNYANREYPFINAGRAHMLKKNYQQALDEFSMALSIAPYHKELRVTIERLVDSLTKSPNEEQADLTQ